MFRRRSLSARRRSARSSSGLKSLSRTLSRALNPAVQQRAAVAAQRRALRRKALKFLATHPAEAQQVMSAAKAAEPDSMQVEDPKAIFGRGGYWGRMLGGFLGGLTGNSTIKSLATSAFDKAGDYIADRIPGGNLLASGAEALYKAASGRGDYTLGDSSQIVPSFAGGSMDHVRIRSREYLGPILGSAPLRIDNFVLNPGDTVTFPKLSKLAQFYQQYIMNGCIFYYKSTSGISTNSADTAIGQIHMAMNYDSGEPLYTSKQDLVGSQYANSGLPAQDIVHGVECAAFTNGSEVKRIRHGDSGDAKADPLATDQGRFYIAVEGTNAAATRLGELWVTYDVSLIKSRDSKGGEVAAARGKIDNATAAALFGSSLPWYYNTIGCQAFGNQLVFNKYSEPGLYKIVIRTQSSGQPATGNSVWIWNPPAITTMTGGTVVRNRTESNGMMMDISAISFYPLEWSAEYYIKIDVGAGVSTITVTFSDNMMIFNNTNFNFVELFVTRVPDALLS